MKLICQIEGCGHLSENRDIGLCATHAREARKAAAPKAKPARKRIAKVSEEGKERMAVYNGIKAIWIKLPENVTCHVCEVKPTTEPHHQRGKISDLLYDVRYWLPVCRTCHEFIERNPEMSYREGWSQLRLANEPHEI